MNSYVKKRLVVLAAVLIFAVCIALIVVGQRNIGWGGLGVMLLGLCGILVMLYLYNRSVEKPEKFEQKEKE